MAESKDGDCGHSDRSILRVGIIQTDHTLIHLEANGEYTVASFNGDGCIVYGGGVEQLSTASVSIFMLGGKTWLIDTGEEFLIIRGNTMTRRPRKLPSMVGEFVEVSDAEQLEDINAGPIRDITAWRITKKHLEIVPSLWYFRTCDSGGNPSLLCVKRYNEYIVI
jgi:hypothetical protein